MFSSHDYTDKVYLNQDQIYDFKENDTLGGNDPTVQ